LVGLGHARKHSPSVQAPTLVGASWRVAKHGQEAKHGEEAKQGAALT